MKKIFVIIASVLCLAFTGCSDLWNWMQEEEDKTYIYTCYAGTMTETYFTNNFTTRFTSQLTNGYYDKNNSNFSSRVDELRENFKTVSSVGDRMSVIEPKLQAAGFNSLKITEVELKARNETEVLYVSDETYRWIYMKLTNIR